MNLIIDIGNSRSKIALYHNSLVYSDAVSLLTVEYLDRLCLTYPHIDACLLAATGSIPVFLEGYLQTKVTTLLLLNHELKLPIENTYQSPQTLGHDRLAAVVAASALFDGLEVLVIDSGTAITYDFINKDKQYLGGNISLGLSMRYQALHHFTSRLPLLDPFDYPPIGRNTNEAIHAGVALGLVSEINYYINTYANHQIVLTGGDRFYLAKQIKSPLFVVGNLVDMGLNLILQYNLSEP